MLKELELYTPSKTDKIEWARQMRKIAESCIEYHEVFLEGVRKTIVPLVEELKRERERARDKKFAAGSWILEDNLDRFGDVIPYDPDWKFYYEECSENRVILWRLVAYSLNLNPNIFENVWQKDPMHGGDFRVWLAGCGTSYRERLLLAEGSVMAKKIQALMLDGSRPHEMYVYTNDFISWTNKQEWEVPTPMLDVKGELILDNNKPRRGGRRRGQKNSLTLLIETTYHSLYKENKTKRLPTPDEVLLEIEDHDEEQIIQEITKDKKIFWVNPVTRKDQAPITFKTLSNKISQIRSSSL